MLSAIEGFTTLGIVHAMGYRTGLALVQAVTLWSTVFSVPVIVAAAALLHRGAKVRAA